MNISITKARRIEFPNPTLEGKTKAVVITVETEKLEHQTETEYVAFVSVDKAHSFCSKWSTMDLVDVEGQLDKQLDDLWKMYRFKQAVEIQG